MYITHISTLAPNLPLRITCAMLQHRNCQKVYFQHLLLNMDYFCSGQRSSTFLFHFAGIIAHRLFESREHQAIQPWNQGRSIRGANGAIAFTSQVFGVPLATFLEGNFENAPRLFLANSKSKQPWHSFQFFLLSTDIVIIKYLFGVILRLALIPR